MIEQVPVHHGSEGVTLELEWALTAMIGFAQNDKSPLGSGLDFGFVVGSAKVVVGTGLHLGRTRVGKNRHLRYREGCKSANTIKITGTVATHGKIENVSSRPLAAL